MSPALLSVGVGKNQNYTNLSEMTKGLGESGDLSNLDSISKNTDKVSLTYKNVGSKMISDMASLTAETIKNFPDLNDDYVIAIIDDGNNREAKIYSRKEILENFTGSEQEKKNLKETLDKNPMLVFSNSNGLPASATDAGSIELSKKLNTFLKNNAKTLDVLDKAGYDPLADMLGNSTIKKILANFAGNKTKE